jgi:hypothetical protein
LPASPHQTADRLPCHALWPDVPAGLKKGWIDELAISRMQARRDLVEQAYLRTPDLETLLYRALFVGLGYAKNSEPMAELCRRIPLSLARTLDDPLDLEAMLFGIAGLLPYDTDLMTLPREAADYALELRNRFIPLNERFNAPIMARQAWQFFRLRPANFPTLRLAQAAALLGPGGLLQREPIDGLTGCFRQPDAAKRLLDRFQRPPTSFWQHHYHFKRPSSFHRGVIGPERIQKLVMNAVVPILLVHAEHTALPWLEENLVRHLRSMPPEDDEIVARFNRAGALAPDALTTQGLHELYHRYCSAFGCLDCAIGRSILENRS